MLGNEPLRETCNRAVPQPVRRARTPILYQHEPRACGRWLSPSPLSESSMPAATGGASLVDPPLGCTSLRNDVTPAASGSELLRRRGQWLGWHQARAAELRNSSHWCRT